MSGKRIAVLVSGGGTNLRPSLDAQARGRSAAVRSQPFSPPRGRLCAGTGRKGRYPRLRRRPEELSRQPCHDTRHCGPAPDAGHRPCGVGRFLHILTEEMVQAYPNRILNVHPALIPSFCGAGCYGLHVHEKALAYGVKVTGATVHFVTEEPDGGPIVLQKAVDIREDDTPETLQRRVMEEAEWQLLPRAVSLFCEDRLSVEGRLVRIRD
ncbi:MAG: phosphoribosylglycinamide formyltransferase [Intestinimonas sp.]